MMLPLPRDKGEVSAIVYPSGTHPKEVDREIPKPIPGMGLIRFPDFLDSDSKKILAALSLSKLKPNTEYCATILEREGCNSGRYYLTPDESKKFKLKSQFITDDEGKMNGNLEFISDQTAFKLNAALVLQEGTCSATQSEVRACGEITSRLVRKGIHLHT